MCSVHFTRVIDSSFHSETSLGKSFFPCSAVFFCFLFHSSVFVFYEILNPWWFKVPRLHGILGYCYCLVARSCLTLFWPHGLRSAMLLCPWDFPGKNTGVGCHFLIQGNFSTQRSNPCFQGYRWILYHWITREAHILNSIDCLYFILTSSVSFPLFFSNWWSGQPKMLVSPYGWWLPAY